MRRAHNWKHGLSNTPLHRRWNGMKERCCDPRNKAYDHYGGKGITVCEEWLDFCNYLKWCEDNGWHEGLEVDRIDSSKGYGPENCRLVTHAENIRTTERNRRVVLFGEEKCLAEWYRDPRCGVGNVGFYRRIKKGWSIEDALTKPSKKRNVVRKELQKEGSDGA